MRNRIDALERLLQFHGINADASFGQLMAKSPSALSQNPRTGNNPVPTGKAPVSDRQDFNEMFDGALTLDDSLNFDQDGEIRYYGPTSGRLPFRSSPKGKQALALFFLYFNSIAVLNLPF